MLESNFVFFITSLECRKIDNISQQDRGSVSIETGKAIRIQMYAALKSGVFDTKKNSDLLHKLFS